MKYLLTVIAAIVVFAAIADAVCENTMTKEGIRNGQLVAGVTTVPSGAVEVLRKQQEGYGYFRP